MEIYSGNFWIQASRGIEHVNVPTHTIIHAIIEDMCIYTLDI